MEGYERKEGMDNDREEIYSKAVRAGKRTYFFDVKSTRNNDYYLTITESKKRFDNDGNQNFEKHKIFLYKEDFEKFAEGLDEVVAYIQGRHRRRSSQSSLHRPPKRRIRRRFRSDLKNITFYKNRLS